ncbi:MAG: hypothetical protein IT384_22670 [Deltaproteobacteria bacterium]|nr:hypothetical protein [Deltaproteobacteria bacterium]
MEDPPAGAATPNDPIAALLPTTSWPELAASTRASSLPGMSFDAEQPWVIELDSPTDPAELATLLYGDPALALLLGPEARSYAIAPDLLTPRAAAAFQQAFEAQLPGDLASLCDAALRGADALGAELEAQLARWASAPPGARTESMFQRWLRGAEAAARRPDLGSAAGAHEGAVAAHLLVALTRLGGSEGQDRLPSLLRAGVEPVLDAIEDPTSSRDSRIIADFLSNLDPVLQLAALTEIVKHWDDTSAVVLGRFGETAPDGMLYRLFEHLEPADRQSLGDSVVANGVLPQGTVEALIAGRTWAGRNLPWTTGHAQALVEELAAKSDSDDAWTRAAATAGGVLFSTVLPETATSTLITLASGGLAGALALAPTPLRVFIAGASLGATAGFTATDLAEALSGKSLRTGAKLRPEERLARILAAASGVLVLAGGAALAFRAGQLTRLAPGELPRMNAGCVKLDLGGLPPGLEVWVPKDSPLAREGGAALARAIAAGPRPAGLVTRGPAGFLTGPAFASKARTSARAAAGSALVEAMKPLTLGVADRGEVSSRIAPLAEAAARDAYYLVMLAGKTEKQANVAAVRAARGTAKSLVAVAARQLVIVRVEAAIEAGTCFDLAALDEITKARIFGFRAGLVGQVARVLAQRLDGLAEKDLLDVMATEVADGRATVRQNASGLVWEFADGTVIRYKPRGDRFRPGPTYSVEVKKNPTMPDADLEGIAFKVDPKGRAVPKNAKEIAPAFKGDHRQASEAVEYLMELGHRGLRR